MVRNTVWSFGEIHLTKFEKYSKNRWWEILLEALTNPFDHVWEIQWEEGWSVFFVTRRTDKQCTFSYVIVFNKHMVTHCAEKFLTVFSATSHTRIPIILKATCQGSKILKIVLKSSLSQYFHGQIWRNGVGQFWGHKMGVGFTALLGATALEIEISAWNSPTWETWKLKPVLLNSHKYFFLQSRNRFDLCLYRLIFQMYFSCFSTNQRHPNTLDGIKLHFCPTTVSPQNRTQINKENDDP